jgi:hypothetical protein
MTITSLNTKMIFLVLFLSLNSIFSQSLDQNIAYNIPGNNTSHWINSSNSNIKIISILNSDHAVELKKLDHFAAKYKNSNVSFIAVTDKLSDSLSNAIKREIRYYRHLSKNENLKVFNTYQTGMYKVFPIHIILDKEGKIIYKKKGSSNNIEVKLAKRIDKLLLNDSENLKLKEIQYTVR